MFKRGMFLIVFAMLLLASLASAISVTLTNVNSSLATVSVVGAEDLYGYEINFNYDGTISMDDSTNFNGFLTSGADTSYGHSERSSILSVYESRLDNALAGVDGSGELFDVFHSGSLSLNNALFIYNDGTEETICYTSCPDSCGDNVCGSSETCSTCPGDCGSCVDSPSGGGGGGSSATVKLITDISIAPTEFNINLVLNANKEKIIKVTNNGNKAETINLLQRNLKGLVLFKEDSFILAPGETRETRIIFVAPDKEGIYTGTLFVGGNEVFVSMNVQTKELLFDAMIVVPGDEKIISVGDNLDTQITLIPMGDSPRVDVTLNYIVKDFDGNIHLSESETILITDQKNFNKQFSTKMLPTGNYIVGLEVIYPGGVAVSSSHFQVSKKKFLDIRNILVLLIIGIVALAGFVLYALVSYQKKRKKLLKLRKIRRS